MNTRIFFSAAIGVALMSGCAGPLDRRWDDPSYRSIQERYSEHDRLASDGQCVVGAQPKLDLETLDALRLEDAIRIAIDHNPSLRVAGYRIDAASGRVVQAGLYPNPSLSFEAEGLGADDGSGGEQAYVIEQEIVLGGKLERARDVAESDRLAARAAFVAQEFVVAGRVTQAYYAGVLAQEVLTMREELSVLSTQLLDAARAKVQAGVATYPDQLRAEVAFEQSQIELDAARFEVVASKQRLASAIGIESQIVLALSSSIDRLPELPSREELMALTLKANSQVALARIAVIRAKQQHALVKSDAVPNLVASVGPRYSDIDDETTVDLGLSLEIPLFDRNQGEIRAALAERLAASAQLQGVQLDLLGEVGQAWSAYESAKSSADRYRMNLLPKAEQTLDLTQQAYQSGKVDFLRLLDAQQVVIEARIAYMTTLHTLQISAALLNEYTQIHTPWRDPRTDDHGQGEVN